MDRRVSADQDKNSGKFFEATAGGVDDGSRLDRFLAARIPDLSRTRLKMLLLGGQVRVNERTVGDPAYRVKSGEAVRVRVPPPEPARPKAEAIPLNVVHEDDDIVVVDKQACLVVHPAPGNETGTLVNALIAHCGDSLSGIGGEKRPGIVHRLDKDTSGLLVVAKTDRAHAALSRQFADHGRKGALVRGYLALVWGTPEPRRGMIDAPIARDPKARERMAVLPGGRRAVTHYEVRERYSGKDGLLVASQLECRLETGRTHQIRVHLARLGHALIGDQTYGSGMATKEAKLPEPGRSLVRAFRRQALHAGVLGFRHPGNGRELRFVAELPPDMAELVAALRQIGASPVTLC
jgi:23S rRNA pseudouridine1911/1915/1917 synthase